MKTRGLFQKGGSWWIRWTDAGGKYRRELIGSFATAKKMLTIRRREALDGKLLPTNLRKRITVSDLIALAEVHTKQTYSDAAPDLYRLSQLRTTLGTRGAQELRWNDVDAALDALQEERGFGDAARNRYRTILSKCFSLGVKRELVSNNPVRQAAHKKEPEGRVRFLSADEDRRLRASIAFNFPKRMPDFILATNTGLRRKTLYSLTWDMVDFPGRMLNIPRENLKGKREPLHIPLNDAALDALRQLRSENPMVFKDGNERRWFSTCVKHAKIADLHFHDLRHTFASRLRQHGTSLASIADLLGHANLNTTRRYSHLGETQLRAEVAKLDVIPDSTTAAPKRRPAVN